MTQPDESPDLELVTAALRADSADAAVYARVLTESLGESLPPGCVTIERDRSRCAGWCCPASPCRCRSGPPSWPGPWSVTRSRTPGRRRPCANWSPAANRGARCPGRTGYRAEATAPTCVLSRLDGTARG